MDIIRFLYTKTQPSNVHTMAIQDLIYTDLISNKDVTNMRNHQSDFFKR